VRAEASIGDLLAARLHGGGEPQLAEIPVKIAQVADGLQVFAGGDRAFVVDHAAGGSGVASQLGLLLLLRTGDQAVHVNIQGGFEKADAAGVVILDRAAARIFIDPGGEPGVSRAVNFQFFAIRRGGTDVVEVHFVRLQLEF